MKMRRLIYIVGLLLINVSCEKEAPNFNFPITLLPTEYIVTSELKLFTKSGLINDRLIIDNYLAADSLGFFHSKIDTIIKTDSHDTLIYKNQDTVLFSEPGLWGIRTPKKEQNYIYFYLTDTLPSYMTVEQCSELKDIINQIGIYKPFYKEYGSDYMDCFLKTLRVYDARLAKGTPNYLEFPLLTYRLTRTKDNYKAGISRKNYNNVFDMNVLNLLESGDTLAIQEAKIIYKAIE
jgi:hypothetical protein